MSTVKWPKIKRDGLIFITGLGLFIREAVVEDKARSPVLLACMTCMGLPVFLGLDEKGKPKLPDLKKVISKLVEDDDDPPTQPPAEVHGGKDP